MQRAPAPRPSGLMARAKGVEPKSCCPAFCAASRAVGGAGVRPPELLGAYDPFGLEQDRPGAMGAHPQSVADPADGITNKNRGTRRRSRIPRTSPRTRAQSARVSETSSVVPACLPQLPARLRRILQHGVCAERGTPNLLWRTG